MQSENLKGNNTSILENAAINNNGISPFNKNSEWWYITSICIFGVIGMYAERTIYSILNSPTRFDFYKNNLFNGFIYIALPTVFYLFSKVMLLVFMYKKWKFIAQANTTTPYPNNVVWSKYIAPIIYFILASIVLGLVTLNTRGNNISVYLLLRSILLLAFGIYIIIWNYRLTVYYPIYFNDVPMAMKNNALLLPKKIGVYVWLFPIVANIFYYISLFIQNGDVYSINNRPNANYNYAISLTTVSSYLQIGFYLILAIYIYIIIKTCNQFYTNYEELEND